MNLLVVIVCYRVPDLTIECIRSLERDIALIPDSHVAVCENGTGEDSVQTLQEAIKREGWDRWVSLTAISPNRGFAGGNNVILRDAMKWGNKPKYVLLLNADTVIRPGAVYELVEAARVRPRAGIIGPRLEDSGGEPQVSCFRDHHPVSEFIRGAHTGPITRFLSRFEVPMGVFDRPTSTQWTTFACALLRWKVLEEIGLLDEGFYLYFDDADFCRRARHRGWEILHWPKARVLHLGGQSNPVKSLSRQRKQRPAYYYASRSRYLAKHYGTVGLWISNLMWTAGRAMSWAREKFGNQYPQACAGEYRDIWTGVLNPVKPVNTTETES